jgi:hypothetical protein
MIDGRLQALQRFSSSKLVLETVESRFMTLDYFVNHSRTCIHVIISAVATKLKKNAYTDGLFECMQYISSIPQHLRSLRRRDPPEIRKHIDSDSTEDDPSK